MKRLIPSNSLLLVRMAVMFYLPSGNTPQISRSDLLLWRITLYTAISGVGWRLYDRLPPYRPATHRIALWFIVLTVLNRITLEVFR